MSQTQVITKRHDFVLLFDVIQGNPTATLMLEMLPALIRKLDTD